MSTWAGVVRVSHVGGRGGESFHADADQVASITDHARKLRVALEILPPELDVSGGAALEDRPSLLAAVEGVEQGRYEGIMVSYLSRLGRSVREQLRAWDRVEAAGGRIVVVQEGIDTSTPTGRLQRTIMLGIAEHELDLHKERFGNLREWATAAGIWQRRQTPKGYRRDEQTRKLVPDENADVVRAAFADRAADSATISEVARRLAMTTSGARQLLKNRVYLGELKVGEHVNVAAHPPLVDEQTFLLAQRSRPRPPRKQNDKSPALLAGLVRCAGCGHLMPRTSSDGGKYTWYSCARNHSGGQCPEPASISLRRLDEHVELIAVDQVRRLDVSSVDSNVDVAVLDIQIADAELELQTYLSAVSAADVGAAAFGAGARQRQERVMELRLERDAAMLASGIAPAMAGGADGWKALGGNARNEVLRSLIAAVVVRRVGRGARVPVEDRARVVAAGSEIDLPSRSAGAAYGIRPVPFPDADSPSTLRVLDVQ